MLQNRDLIRSHWNNLATEDGVKPKKEIVRCCWSEAPSSGLKGPADEWRVRVTSGQWYVQWSLYQDRREWFESDVDTFSWYQIVFVLSLPHRFVPPYWFFLGVNTQLYSPYPIYSLDLPGSVESGPSRLYFPGSRVRTCWVGQREKVGKLASENESAGVSPERSASGGGVSGETKDRSLWHSNST